MTAQPMCGSKRLIDGEHLSCNRRYNHPSQQKHRAVMDDLSVILWEGANSGEIEPDVAAG